MTLQEYTDKLQELCHQGHAQEKIHLFATIDGIVFMNTLPEINNITHVTGDENSIGINLGNYSGVDKVEAQNWLRL